MDKPSKTVAKPAPGRGTSDRDLVLVHGRGEDGSWRVLRQRGDRVEAGAMRPVEEGKPISGEVVKLRPREEAPILFDAETVYRAEDGAGGEPASDGPAQVASDAYRRNWSRIFGASRRRAPDELPN